MKKILLIDDENYVLDKMKMQLKDYDVITCCDSKKALVMIRQYHYDLIISDISMQPISGTELIFELKKNKKKIPVLLMTGFTELYCKDKIDFFKKNGVIDCLFKPILKKELLNIVKKILEDNNDTV